MTSADRVPFGPGSVSVNLYTYDSLDAVRRASAVVEDARLIDRLGFDGVTVSEHHGGASGYFPAPLGVATWMLEQTERLWVAPMPIVLPLRPITVVLEEVAWLAARHPGRLGLGVAPGYSHDDFDLVGASYPDRVQAFRDALTRLMAVCSGRSRDEPLLADPAVVALRNVRLPVVSAAGSLTAARRAAVAGSGLVFGSHLTPAEARDLVRVYRDAGGVGPVVLGRRLWLGEQDELALARQFAMYQRLGRGDAPWSADVQQRQVISGTSDAVIASLIEALETSGATALSLRLHATGCMQDTIAEQLEGLAAEVLRELRRRLPASVDGGG